MIQLWNSRVNKKDTVYILGDLAFGEVMERLNSTPDLTWLQLILISFIGNLCGSLLCTYIDRYEAKKNKKKENDKPES